jgi:hypothetical protein
MTSTERTAALAGLGRQIAVELRYTSAYYVWTLNEPTEDNVYLRNAENDARIYLGFEGYGDMHEKARVVISGHMHIGKNGQYVEVYEKGAATPEHPQGSGWNRVTAPSITVAASRGCAAIAKGIARRFLPEYLRVYQLGVDKVTADTAYDNAITKNLQRLATVAGETLQTHDRYSAEVQKSFTWKHGTHYDTVTASAEDCSLKLDTLSIEQAEYIIRYLKEGR